MNATVTIAGLTPAMRFCLGTAPAASEIRVGNVEPGLSGLYHGATLAALKRKGLAASEWDSSGAHDLEYRLTPAGLAARALLRDRVDERLAAAGWQRQEASRLYAHPDWPLLGTRAAAMRRSGVTW